MRDTATPTRRPPSTAPFADDQWRRIEAARAEHYQVFFEFYCRNQDCAVREVEVRVKDYDGDLLSALKGRRPTCPLCAYPLALHNVAGGPSYRRQEDADARRSVNAQMRLRDLERDAPGHLHALRATEMIDERLPPTPDGWFTRDDDEDRA
jgi:hypothetical protein